MSLKDIKVGTGGKQAFCDGDHPSKCSSHGKVTAQPKPEPAPTPTKSDK